MRTLTPKRKLEGQSPLKQLRHRLKSPIALIRASRVVEQVKMQVVVKGKNTMFGEADIIANTKRTLTCTCDSMSGEVAAISKADFTKRLHMMDTWSRI
jgi:hypothetical protein